MRTIAFLIELLGWAKIVLSPTLAAVLIGGIILYNKQDNTGILIAASFVFLGFFIGVVWATHIWKKHGSTTIFLSRISASSELDKKD